MQAEIRVPRSLLYIPSLKAKQYLDSSSNIIADALIFDLEDSIANSHKTQARDILINTREQIIDKKIPCYLRINDVRSAYFAEDIKLVYQFEPAVISLPKVESIDEIKQIEDICQEYRRVKGKNIRFRIIIESIKGYYNRLDLMRASDEIFTVSLGYEDLCSELEIERPALSLPSPLNAIIQETLLAAKYFKVPMLDAIYRGFQNESLLQLKEEAEYTKKIGMCGKIAIHPNQLSIINAVFDPNKDITRANQTIEKFSALTDGSAVIVNSSGEMEDMPSLRLAEKILGVS